MTGREAEDQSSPLINGKPSQDRVNIVYLTGKIISEIIRNTTKKHGITAINFRMLYHSNDIPCYISVVAYGEVADKFNLAKGNVVLVRGKLTDDKKYTVGLRAYECNRIR